MIASIAFEVAEMMSGCCKVSEKTYVASCERMGGDASPDMGGGTSTGGSCWTFSFGVPIAAISRVPPGYVLLLWVYQGEEKWGFPAVQELPQPALKFGGIRFVVEHSMGATGLVCPWATWDFCR